MTREAASPPEFSLREGQTFGSYRIIRAIGLGGMGEVYEAVQESTGRHVALKVMAHRLDSELDRKRFLREGRLAASVSHPNTVYIFGSDEIEDRPVIVMELVRAGTLKERVKAAGPMAARDAVDTMLQVIDGLETAEAGGVLHRDVKPANCFVDDDGTVKVGDFGLSISTQARPESMLTTTGTLLGTPSFASPEQLRGEPLDVKSDIYSVGATLYYLLTGQPPLEGKELVHIISQVLDEPPKPPHTLNPVVPRGLSRIVLRCLAKSGSARYADYHALRKALTPWGSGAARPAPLGRRTVANILDGLLLMLLWLVPGMLDASLKLFAGAPGARPTYVAYIVANVLFYAVAEAVWGFTPGKAALRLRVQLSEGGPVGFARALARSVVFHSSEILPVIVLLAVVSPAVMASNPEQWENVYVSAGIVLFVGLFVTMRRRNGFAAVHDLVSGTRVVGRRTVEQRPTMGRSSDAGVERTARPAAEPDTAVVATGHYGPYVVARSYAEESGARLLLAEDPVLRRRIVVIDHVSSSDRVTPARRDLTRAARVRWLGGEQSGEGAWDAFELPDGVALLDPAMPTVEWLAVRTWLRDIAVELRAGMADPATAAAASLDRIWITRAGRILLLDFPAPGAQRTDQTDTTPIRSTSELQRFLFEIATRALSVGGARSSRKKRPGPVPLHATEFITKLEQEKFTGYEEIREALTGMGGEPAALSATARWASLALPVLNIVGMMAIGVDVERSDLSEWTDVHPDLQPPTVLALVHRKADLADETEVHAALLHVLAARYREIFEDSAFWADSTLESRVRRFRPVTVSALAVSDPMPAELAAADSLLVRPIANARQAILQTGAIVGGVIAVILGGLISLASSILFRRVPLFIPFRIAVVDRSGRRASRLRLFWRGAVGWTLAALSLLGVRMIGAFLEVLSAGSVALDPSPLIGILPEVLRESWILVLPVALVAAVFIAVTSLTLRRAPQDYLSRTWLVPR